MGGGQNLALWGEKKGQLKKNCIIVFKYIENSEKKTC